MTEVEVRKGWAIVGPSCYMLKFYFDKEFFVSLACLYVCATFILHMEHNRLFDYKFIFLLKDMEKNSPSFLQ